LSDATLESPIIPHMEKEEKTAVSHWVSRLKLELFGATLLVFGLTWAILERGPEEPPRPYTDIIELALPDQAIGRTPTPSVTPGADSQAWHSVTVKPGQTLDAIFRQEGFSIALLQEIVQLNGDTKGLTKIRPGDVFDFKRDAGGELTAMRYPINEENYLIVRQAGDELTAETQARQIWRESEQAQGVITSSLFMAGKEAGLTDQMVMKLANIFGWDIDFVLDIREGDRFMLVYEKIYRDGEFLREGNILAATFINQGERFQAIWYENGDIADYFAPDGRNMRKAFLRAPLNFSYISSEFNPRRMHPVLKRIRPHNGIDYFAPRGTPVYAAGAGTVIQSGYGPANGNHVFIRHANDIVTKYLHFTKATVKKGQKVQQGQTIGYVGSTGLATGPHLHYEFVLNGVHRNPRTVPLPKVEPLKGELLMTFQQRSAPMLTQLSRLESASLYAQRQ
jgi:murein DD-endopeptidase MepM/ murein hydrolase activator NlpD